MKTLGAVVICVGMTINSAYAEFQFIGEPEGLLVGVAVGAEYSIYQQTDQPMVGAMPYIAYEWENLHIGIGDVAYEFFDDRTLALTASIEPRWSFASVDDSAIFEGIEREGAIELGLKANYQIHKGLVSAWYVDGKLLQDVSGVHSGQEMALALGFNREFATLEFDATTGVIYRSKALSRHLYGVTGKEAAETELSAFKGNASAHPFIDMSVQLPLWGDSLFVINASSELYSADIQQSPLIDKALQTDLLMGIVAQF